MHSIFLGLAMAVFAAGPTAKSDQTDVMAAVRQFIDGFNKGDVTRTVGAWAKN